MTNQQFQTLIDQFNQVVERNDRALAQTSQQVERLVESFESNRQALEQATDQLRSSAV